MNIFPRTSDESLRLVLRFTKIAFGIALIIISLSAGSREVPEFYVAPTSFGYIRDVLGFSLDLYAFASGIAGILLVIDSKGRLMTFLNLQPLMFYLHITVQYSFAYDFPVSSEVRTIYVLIGSLALALLILVPQEYFTNQ